jgi:hypothetical protein
MFVHKLAVLGVAALALSGCVANGNQIGQGATYENSASIVTIDVAGQRSLDCLSGPWENTIWYDNGVLRNHDGTEVAEGTSLDRVADHACREYFAARSRGTAPEAAAQLARNIFRDLT